MVHGPRRRARGPQRILYWFRTPPGVRVGRTPLDEPTIRLIEHHHPDIRFDWPRILRGEEEQNEPPAEPAPAEGDTLARLRARHAEVQAAIRRLVPDPDRRARLFARAERLNPDRWLTSDQRRLGIEQFEEVFQALRTAIGGRRRREGGHARGLEGSQPPAEPVHRGTGPAGIAAGHINERKPSADEDGRVPRTGRTAL